MNNAISSAANTVIDSAFLPLEWYIGGTMAIKQDSIFTFLTIILFIPISLIQVWWTFLVVLLGIALFILGIIVEPFLWIYRNWPKG